MTSKVMVQLLLIQCLLSPPLFYLCTCACVCVWGGGVWSLFCCALLSGASSVTIISLENRELVAFF